MSDDEYDPFTEALGVNVGLSSRDEIINAFHAHSTGPVIERVSTADGEFVSERVGWVEYVDALGFYADEDAPGRFVLSPHGHDRPVFNPVRQRNEARPSPTEELEIPEGEMHRHLGGFTVRQPDGQTVRFVLWNALLHETDSGDVAPGFGGFEADLEDDS